MNIYDEIRLNKKRYTPKRSATWMMNNIRMFGLHYPSFGPMKMLGDGLTMQTSSPSIGSMYMFTYDPIHKKTLPYYDKFPLVIPFSVYGKYFTGLNLHYLHPRLRLVLLNRLMETNDDAGLTETAKLKANWQLLKHASNFPEVGPCVKMYHIGHVKSMYLKVAPKDWVMSIFLPLERFTTNNNVVWDDSKKRIK
jgi:hypothetical protein